jgi:hypothetical protein
VGSGVGSSVGSGVGSTVGSVRDSSAIACPPPQAESNNTNDNITTIKIFPFEVFIQISFKG